MSERINQIFDQVKNLTLLEAAELVARLEEAFGIDTSIKTDVVAVTASVAIKKVEEIEEKTEFDVMLEEVPADKKIPILKVVRSLTGLGLKEAKELVESAPKRVKEKLNKEDAEDVKKQIEQVGGKVSLK